MSMHSSTPEFTRTPAPPKHSKGWTLSSKYSDSQLDGNLLGQKATPGKHAKPFGKHHPAMPVTYDAGGTVTPLRPIEHRLDVAA